jgi:hypothetical protein
LYLIYFLSFFIVLIWSDFVNLPFISIGPVNIFPIDCVLIILLIFLYKKKDKLTSLFKNKGTKYYSIFILWIIIAVIRGIPEYSFSAIGDSRQIFQFYFFFASYFLIIEEEDLAGIIKKFEFLFYLFAYAVIIEFILELILGHKIGFSYSLSAESNFGYLEDIRGKRILDTHHTFCACLFIFYVLIKYRIKSKINVHDVILCCILFFAILLSQNRTSIFSVFFAGIFYFIFINKKGTSKLKSLFYLAISILAFLLLYEYISKIFNLFSIEDLIDAFTNPTEEITGTGYWRYFAILSALDTFFKYPILGEGFGNHWQVVVDNIIYYVGPHNQYIVILVKTGIVGLVLFIIALVFLFKQYPKIKNLVSKEVSVVFEVIFVALIAAIPYGLAYDFYPMFGLFAGIFIGIINRTEMVNEIQEQNVI